MNSGAPATSSVATLFSRRVKRGHEAQYEEWLSGISAATRRFPGSLGTTIVRPSGDRHDYVVVIHFETPELQSAWLESSERAHWVAKLEEVPVESEEVRTLTGLESCFVLPGEKKPLTPPKSKTAVLVFVGLYPLVLTLGLVLGPLLEDFPRPVAVFLQLLVSVPLMVFFVLPTLTRLFSRWLRTETQ